MKLLSLFFILTPLLFAEAAYSKIITVTPELNTAPNQSSHSTSTVWANAIHDLQEAIDLAEDGDEIWIAEGVYKTPINTDDHRSTGFKISSKRIKLIGGFLGFEKSLTKRQGSARNTVIDGNINSSQSSSDNAYRLLRVSGHIQTPVHLTNISFVNGFNDRSDLYPGGAVYISGSVVSIDNCHFANNYSEGSGAAIFKHPIGGAKILNSSFEDNHSERFGGALWTVGGIIFNTRFERNSAALGGGAMYFEPVGGAAHLFFNNVFWRNSAAQGGAVYGHHPCIPFPGSTLPWEVQCNGKAQLFVNNTFVENDAVEGGAFYQNEFIHGGNLINNIFWNNLSTSNTEMATTGGQIGGDLWNVSHNDFSSPYIGDDDHTGNRTLSRNPFVDSGAGDFRLLVNSEPVDAAWMPIHLQDHFNLTLHFSFVLDYLDMNQNGILVEAPPFDHDGGYRWVGDRIDRGAFESQMGRVR